MATAIELATALHSNDPRFDEYLSVASPTVLQEFFSIVGTERLETFNEQQRQQCLRLLNKIEAQSETLLDLLHKLTT